MFYIIKNDFEEEEHSWPPYIAKNANKLILGTFPTADRNRKLYKFYYPNPNNDFWKIIFTVAGKELSSYSIIDPIKTRKDVLDELGLAIADMGKKVLRQRGSSTDSNLFPLIYTDVLLLLDQNPSINTIIITSSSGGNSVLSWFHHYCSLNGIKFKKPKGVLPLKTDINFKGKNITLKIIPSPSRISPIKGEKLIDMYRNAILS
ncbi:MAG: hypothetical protein EOO42_06505 [Flavobacteriales bacterium]|nr:MAG: hypothetical protein EOO42_06505 [Flavobacteriales bacterium]